MDELQSDLDMEAKQLLDSVFPEKCLQLTKQIETFSEEERLRLKQLRESATVDEQLLDPIAMHRSRICSEIQTLAAQCSILKTWISLKTPKIEGGNNFGVAIQRGIACEVAKVMDYCNKVSVQISSHQTTRGDQVKRVNKHPLVEDHKWGLREGDEMEFYDLKEITVNLRNFYLLLSDMIGKNYSKVTQPKTVKSTSVMY
ncbi:proteasome activator complex subunit 3-like [Symsagittifera roscoffensis]|uniref:proteasome activator complex subunit 3-like n=1 Tax=Symsagittifera roscoffensis TaxID=84072 RepID=UPI00307C2D30